MILIPLNDIAARKDMIFPSACDDVKFISSVFVMARRKKRGDQQNQPQNNGDNVKKKIEKRSVRKKEAALVQAASASVALAPADVVPVPADVVQAPASYIGSAAPVPVNGAAVVSHGRTDERGGKDRLSGFIFMCNGATKPECYKYRVFGLPSARVNDVEKIKEGMKIFLYDFDLKLLYGVYKAASSGGRNLEAAAFGGRFPAQVRFEIMTDCLPLPESEFKHAILENYDGRKFRPELNKKQVQKLVAMFRPITLPPSGQVPHSLPNVAHAQAYPSPPTREWYQHPVKAPVHAALLHIGHAPPPLEARYAQPIGLVPQDGSYYADPRVPYMPNKPALHAQDPHSRYMAAPPGRVHQDRLLGRDDEYHHHRSLLEKEHVQHMDHLDAYYNQLPAQSTSHGLPQQPFAPALPYAAPASHVSDYYPTMAYQEPKRLYGQSLQGSAAGTAGHPGGNAPVTSRYSFAGPAPTYH